MSGEPLIFLHLPKTAGTTFNTVLLRHFDPGEVHLLRSRGYEENLRRFVSLPREQRHRIRLLRGHQVFGLHVHLAPGARYLTLLRDPVDRIVSHYEYVRATEHPMFIDAIRRDDLSLLDYATSGISGELENGQTRWIAGIADDRPLGEADLALAIRHLDEHFAWVGLVEHFDESLVELGVRMRWLRVDYRARNVGATPRGPVDPAVRQAIVERNQLDVELYDHVRRGFLARHPAYRGARRAAAHALRTVSTRRPRQRVEAARAAGQRQRRGRA